MPKKQIERRDLNKRSNGVPKGRVLLVEDRKPQREGYRAILQGMNYQVTGEAINPVQAFEQLSSGEKPNLVLCDLILPPSGKIREGINLINAVREDYRMIQIVAYSEGMTEWALMRLLETGVSCLHPDEWEDPAAVDLAFQLTMKGWATYSRKIREMLVALLAGEKSKPPLSYHKMRIAALHLQGLSTQEIHLVVGTGTRTIDNHLNDIYRAANLVDRSDPARFNKLSDWFIRICDQYDFEFDPHGRDINLDRWSDSWYSPKK